MRIAMFVAVLTAVCAAQQDLVVPSTSYSNDANSLGWLAGCSTDLHQQTLIGASHLGALVGHTITAMEVRRTAENETFLGGAVHWTVSLSQSPRTPLSASRQFIDNLGTGSPVFSGTVAVPTSPAIAGPAVPWSAANVVRVVLQQQFFYSGGTLCVDVVGSPVIGQEVNWWPADCTFEDIAGTAVDLGPGCGQFGGSNRQSSYVGIRSLLAGGHAQFAANGVPGDLAFMFVGGRALTPVPLGLFGLPAPADCFVYVAPSTIMGTLTTTFGPAPHPALAGLGGVAEQVLPLPNQPWILGMPLSSQWMDLQQQFAVSNGIEWTVATAVPSLDMTHIEGGANETVGFVSVHQAHVFRFEYQ